MSVYYALFKDGEMVKNIPPCRWPGDVAVKASIDGYRPVEYTFNRWMEDDVYSSILERVRNYRRRVNYIVDEYGLMDFDEGYIIKAVHSETKEESL